MHTITIADDQLVTGAIYTIRWFATNQVGEGIRSDEIRVALSDRPSAPTNLRKLSQLSTQSVITVAWDPVASGALPGGEILGYKLWI